MWVLCGLWFCFLVLGLFLGRGRVAPSRPPLGRRNCNCETKLSPRCARPFSVCILAFPHSPEDCICPSTAWFTCSKKNKHPLEELLLTIRRSGGCGQSFEAVIVSAQFAKKTLLQRHRLVNGAIKDEVAAIHAWTPKCFTPEEFEKKVGELQQQQQQGGGRKEKSVSSKQDEGKVTTTWDNKSMSASHSTGSVTEPVDGSAGSSGVLGTVKKAVIG